LSLHSIDGTIDIEFRNDDPICNDLISDDPISDDPISTRVVLDGWCLISTNKWLLAEVDFSSDQ